MRGNIYKKKNHCRVVLICLAIVIIIPIYGCGTQKTITQQAPPEVGICIPQSSAVPPVPVRSPENMQSKAYTIGLTMLGEETDFFTNVKDSTFAAAEENGIIVLYKVNDRNPERMDSVINEFVAQGADMVIDFTVLPEQGSMIAAELKEKGIPLLSIDCVYEDAYFFGIDNFNAGRAAGRFLATEINDRWDGQVDAMLMLYAEVNGEIVKQRVSGAYDGLIEAGIDVKPQQLNYININTPTSKQTNIRHVTNLVKDFMDAHSEKHIGVVAASDDIALGALAAMDAAGRMDDFLMVSHNCDPSAVENFKYQDNAWIGSVNYNSLSYGEQIIELCIGILKGVEYDQKNYIDTYVVSIYNVFNYFGDETGMDEIGG